MLGLLEITSGYAGDICFEQVDQMDQAIDAAFTSAEIL
jgi:hypothetical protein